MSDSTDNERVVATPSEFQKKLKASAYPVAAVAGGLYGHRYVRNSLYDTLKKDGAFKTESDKLHSESAELIQKAEGDIARGVKTDLRGKFRPKSKLFAEEVTKGLKGMGFNNTIDYFKELPGIQQMEALGIAVSAATVALGVIVTISDNNLLDTLSHRHKSEAQR